MIIVKLMGGLGNQMFQYSCGLQLATHHDVALLLDLGFIEDRTEREDFTIRDYELNVFQLPVSLATNYDTKKYYRTGLIPRLLRKIKLINVVQEEGRTYNENILRAPRNCYLIGYWQSDKYFSEVVEKIRTQFCFPKEPENEYIFKLSNLIRSTNSVGIHIRRGDYAYNKKINSMFGVLQLDYYKNGIEYISDKIDNITLFIFSDDPDWVSHNIDFKINTVYVQHNQKIANYIDMKLMSLCKHNIIANSSYSWWGAWLNNNPNKIVIAPKNWYAGIDNAELIKDRIPADWLKFF